MLDLREGRWLTDKQAADATVDPDDLADAEDVKERERVIPYVEDRRNILLVRAGDAALDRRGRGLPALPRSSTAIQVEFQLEDAELAAEALPDRDGTAARHPVLRGGRGRRRRPAPARSTSPTPCPRVARQALELCHFDPDTGADLGTRAGRHASAARRPATTACSPTATSATTACSTAQRRRRSCCSLRDARRRGRRRRTPPRRPAPTGSPGSATPSLERAASISWLAPRGRRLPDDAQRTIEACRARPDFVYDGTDPVAVFIDGPVHDYPTRQQRDDREPRARSRTPAAS